MTRKKDDSNGNWEQLDLPFGNFDSSTNSKSQESNVIQFSSKMKEIQIKKENNVRERSINRLVNRARELKW